GYSIAHQSEARPAAVAALGDGGSWVEQAFQRQHWRASSTRPASSLRPAITNSLRSTAILETLQTSATLRLIIAVRSPAFRVGRVGISAPVSAASTARPENRHEKRTAMEHAQMLPGLKAEPGLPDSPGRCKQPTKERSVNRC